MVERPNGASGSGGFQGSSTSSASGSGGGGSGSEEDGEAAAPPVIAPGLFESVAVEWQRLRLAVQDI